MTNIWNDLFASYRKYKGKDIDSPAYEPLENEVVSKETLKKLKAKEYNEKNKEKNKIKRLEKIVDQLRRENQELKENLKNEKPTRDELLRVNDLLTQLERKNYEFEEFRKGVRMVLKYL